MEQSKLEPCPFCGGEATFRDYTGMSESAFVGCSKCYVETDGYHTLEAATAAWNRRSSTRPLLEGWRPIETAPRDGIHMLLAFGHGAVCEGWWSAEIEGNWDEPPCLAGWTVPTLGSFNDYGLKPTHWMPLPPSPTPGEPAGGAG